MLVCYSVTLYRFSKPVSSRPFIFHSIPLESRPVALLANCAISQGVGRLTTSFMFFSYCCWWRNNSWTRAPLSSPKKFTKVSTNRLCSVVTVPGRHAHNKAFRLKETRQDKPKHLRPTIQLVYLAFFAVRMFRGCKVEHAGM